MPLRPLVQVVLSAMRSITHVGARGGGRVITSETQTITRLDGSMATRTVEQVRMPDGTVTTHNREVVVEPGGRPVNGGRLTVGKTRET